MAALLSKKAACNSDGQDSSYFLGWQEYEKNPYHRTANPNGIIQMGLAENTLSFDLLESWLWENPDPCAFKRNGEPIFRELALFQDYHGLPTFKNALVHFMSDIRGNRATFDTNNLVLTAGATSANETLIFCLADSGDAFLVPTPYYPGFDRDLKWRTGVEIVPIESTSSDGFRITASALDRAYHLAEKQNLRVKGILVTNPSNPLSTALTRAELDLLFHFARHRNLHIVSDEIYSGTAFGQPPDDFISVAELLAAPANADLVGHIHIVYSLSKDLGLPGFRIGCIYSGNPRVVAAATKMSSFGLVSSQTQHLLSAMLSDRKFSRHYLEENRLRTRARQEKLVAGLAAIGIPCLRGNAGLFCWADMSGLLGCTQTFAGEKELWRRMVCEVGLNISAGESCHCSEPGWFRICFANMSEETLDVAISRLRSFVEMENNRSKWVFRLPLAGRERER